MPSPALNAGTPTGNVTVEVVQQALRFVQVSAGERRLCGLKADRSLACWGNDSDGQATPPVGSFSQVSAGGFHSCALKSNGSLACWGDDTFGQATPPAGSFSQVSAEATATCWSEKR